MVERVRTVCNRDCPDSCGIIATVQGGRVVQLAGDPDHPVTRGFLCHRTNQFLESQYSPERLTQPLLRRNKQAPLEPVAWPEALDFAADKLGLFLRESGPSSIMHYRSGGTLGLVVAQASELFFEQLGPVTVKRGDICTGAGEAAQFADFGICDSSPVSDLLNAKHILLWGKNVVTSSPHCLVTLRQARAAGAELVLIDPVHHKTARFCDRFVQPRPGGDFALAMATAQLLFSGGGVDPAAASYCNNLEQLRALANSQTAAQWCQLADVDQAVAEDLAARLAGSEPTTILVGWGMARRVNGGAIVRALDALAAISGNIGIEGGGVSYYFNRKRGFRTLTRERAPERSICEPLFGQQLEATSDPPVRAVWVTAGNPVAMLPESATVARALASRELLVVVDWWLSDTAQLADLVLPTTTLLEADDVLGAYGHHYLGEARPVVQPPVGVKSDLEIFRALASRMGLDTAVFGESARDFKQRLLGEELRAAGVSLDALSCQAIHNPLAPKVLFADRRFATPSGKIELINEAPPAASQPDDLPLFLMALSTPKSQSSQWVEPPAAPLEVIVHPDAAPDLADGEQALLVSSIGQLTVRVRHDPRQRRDVVIAPKGGHYRDGCSANTITRAQLTDIGEGGALYDERVRLAPLEPATRSES